MNEQHAPGASPVERILDHERILAALRQAVREALWMHKRLGRPAAIWKDGRVQWVPPEELPGPDPQAPGSV